MEVKIRTLLAVLLAGAWLSTACAHSGGDGGAPPEAALGEISFPTSAGPRAQARFLRGVLLLHSFEYDDAREAFREAQAIEPGFALAYWGEAMTYNHPLWGWEDAAAARTVLRRLAPTQEERLARAPTERERGYLRAVHALYGEGDKRLRDRRYANAMRELTQAFPEDLEAASFLALAILGTSYGERDVAAYMRAAGVAEEVFMRNPHHPGALHYLIHAYDDPAHAPLGLRPARIYAGIAPDSAHARHMPSHIFLALGMWDEVVAANEAAWAAADARVARRKLPVDERDFHALYWLAYAYLQQGRHEDAGRALETMRADAEESGSGYTRTQLIYLRAAHLVETQDWKHPAARVPIDHSGLDTAAWATDAFAMGAGAVAAGEWARAEAILVAMRGQRTATGSGEADEDAEHAGQQVARILDWELEGFIRLRRGEPREALAALRAAATAEDALSYTYGPPWPVKPARELLGEALLELGEAREAMREFQRVLESAPRRSRALYGLGRAALASGDAGTAQSAYETLRTNWRHAPRRAPELRELEQRLER